MSADGSTNPSQSDKTQTGDPEGRKLGRKIKFFAYLPAMFVVERLMKGDGPFARRILPILVGIIIYSVLGVATAVLIGVVDATDLGIARYFFGPAAWIIVVGAAFGTVNLCRRRYGRIAAIEVAIRAILAAPIVFGWLVICVGLVVVGIPTILLGILATGAGAILLWGKRPTKAAFPLLAIAILLLIASVPSFYGNPAWFQIVGAISVVVVAFCIALWLQSWTYKPLMHLQRLIVKYRDYFDTHMGERCNHESRSKKKERFGHSIENELDKHQQLIDTLGKRLPSFLRHRFIFHGFVAAFIVVVGYCVAAYAVAYMLLVRGGVHMSVVSSSDMRSDWVHACVLSLNTLVLADYGAVAFNTNFATLLHASQIVLGVVLFVILILSFSTASSTYTESVEREALAVLEDMGNKIAGYRLTLVALGEVATPQSKSTETAVELITDVSPEE